MDDMQVLDEAIAPDLPESAPDPAPEGDFEGDAVQDVADTPALEEEIPEETTAPVETPAPEASAPAGPSVVVISGDTAAGTEDTAEDEALEDYHDSGPVVVVQQPPLRPLLTTSFADYSVTEGLLLLLVLGLVLSVCVKMVKGGFAWLR